jgi:hypothetical protein
MEVRLAGKDSRSVSARRSARSRSFFSSFSRSFSLSRSARRSRRSRAVSWCAASRCVCAEASGGVPARSPISSSSPSASQCVCAGKRTGSRKETLRGEGVVGGAKEEEEREVEERGGGRDLRVRFETRSSRCICATNLRITEETLAFEYGCVVWCVWCVWCVGVCGVWCVVCGVWCVVCGVSCVVCGVWCVCGVCGAWCVVCVVCGVVCDVWCGVQWVS